MEISSALVYIQNHDHVMLSTIPVGMRDYVDDGGGHFSVERRSLPDHRPYEPHACQLEMSRFPANECHLQI